MRGSEMKGKTARESEMEGELVKECETKLQ